MDCARARCWSSRVVNGSPTRSSMPAGVFMNSKNSRPPGVENCCSNRETTCGRPFTRMGRNSMVYPSCRQTPEGSEPASWGVAVSRVLHAFGAW